MSKPTHPVPGPSSVQSSSNAGSRIASTSSAQRLGDFEVIRTLGVGSFGKVKRMFS